MNGKSHSTTLAGAPELSDLAALEQPRDMRVLLKILFSVSALLVLGSLVLAAEQTWQRFIFLPIMALFINVLIQMLHDAWHYNLFSRRIFNRLYGAFISLPSLIMFEPARHDHWMHHKYNRTARDPDAYNTGRPSFLLYFQYYLVFFLGVILAPLHFNILYPLAWYKRSRLPAHFRSLFMHLLAFGLIFFLIGWFDAWTQAFWVWFMPLLLASPLNGLKSIADHIDNDWEGNNFRTATETRSNFLGRFFYHGLNYHLTHHLYWKVPGPRLREIHERIAPELKKNNAVFHSGFFKVLLRALRGPQFSENSSMFSSSEGE